MVEGKLDRFGFGPGDHNGRENSSDYGATLTQADLGIYLP